MQQDPQQDWVGRWGFCTDCEGLTRGTLCDDCRGKRAAEQARMRPHGVVAMRPSEAEVLDRKSAVMWIPDDASPALVAVARAVAIVATIRLCVGDNTTEFALRRVALGRDKVRQIVEMCGGRLDRKTVANQLEELCRLGVLQKVGQLPGWFDYAAGCYKRGAFVYALRVGLRRIGSRPRATFERFLPITTMNAAFRGQHRAERASEAAISYAQEGNRNGLGHWLARRCMETGLSFQTASTYMQRFQKSVAGLGHLYGAREAQRTLSSVYRARKVTRSDSVICG